MNTKIGIGILALVFFLIFSYSFAQETKPLKVNQPSASPVDYVLPYPGILPDNPLYLFKKIRDGILDLLISKPKKQAEFHLLQADKHLSMGIFLMNKGNTELAKQTLEKGVGYLRQTEELIFKIPASEKDQTNNLKDNLQRSFAKHKEIIQGYAVPGSKDEAFFLKLVANIEYLMTDFSNRK